jgi:hypothetical protein
MIMSGPEARGPYDHERQRNAKQQAQPFAFNKSQLRLRATIVGDDDVFMRKTTLKYNFRFILSMGAILATVGCLQLPDMSETSYGAAPAPYPSLPAAPAYQPPPYQPPPPLSVLQPLQSAPLPVVAGPTTAPQVRYLPPQPFASTSLITPAPSSSSPSLIGPQRTDWKPGGGF